jgi:hypothetical protein
MITRRECSFAGALALWLAILPLSISAVRADDQDPPGRAARIADLQGSTSFEPAGTQDWVTPALNRPMTTGDKIWSDRDGRIELQLDGSVLRLSSNTALAFLNLSDQVTQVQLTAGMLIVHVRELSDAQTFEIDTPNLAFSVLRPGVYRLSVDDTANTTAIAVRAGQGEVTGGGAAYTLHRGESDSFAGTDQLTQTAEASPAEDALEDWSASRDDRFDNAAASQYVDPNVVGYEDLDANGAWQPTPDYGYVWFPARLQPGWAPYHFGHWAYISPWGYTWVDDQPWGYAPFHYGRWCFFHDAWGWIPAPRRPPGPVYVRPVYAPALVAWVGAGAAVAWFALGPREVFVPSYPVSRSYVQNINVSNTTVTTTVVNNIYRTTLVNERTVNITYANRGVPGAVAVTTAQAFASALPVARNPARVDVAALAKAPVESFAPRELPTKQAVLGGGRVSAGRPPAAALTRPVVARVAAPPPAASFESHLQALRASGGKPLSVAQERALQPAGARNNLVRLAPAVTPRGAPQTTRPPPSVVRNDQPPTAIHPNELPQMPRPASPGGANSALEREQLQEQQRLQAQQEAERQRVQAQQELEHQQLLRAQADATRKQQLEQQHQQQTQELQLRHQQQQQLQQHQQQQQRQQEERRAPAPPARPASRSEDHR